MCESADLVEFLDLGYTPLADAFLTDEALREPETTYPLTVLLCASCGLSQLSYTVRPELLFPADYPYESSTTESGRNHFHRMAAQLLERFAADRNGLAVDIGSNVGVLLSGFETAGMREYGIEPAESVATTAIERGIPTVHDFFGADAVSEVVKREGQARIVTGTNVFAHIDDLVGFMSALEILLADDGVLVIEAPYFVELLQNLEYDTIYHEHLSYLSVKPTSAFFSRHGFELFDVDSTDIHGGSVRYFVSRPGRHPLTGRVEEAINRERSVGAGSMDGLRTFAARVADHKSQLVNQLFDLKRSGNRLVGVSAPAKGNTLLNYCGIGPDLLDYLTEKAEVKIGLNAPGTHLPVVADSRLVIDQPDYGLVLAWNFGDEIMRNQSAYRKAGGKFILPIPTPRVV